MTTGPLHGLRIVELAAIGPVPFAGMMLADLGADVIRVDRVDGDRPFQAWHRILDRGRRSLAVDLKDPRGAEIVRLLLRDRDVLLEGFRPGVAERLGVGPKECQARNPRLVYGRMTGWGQRGPLARTPGHDINYLALSGALDAVGRADGPPAVPLNLIGDFAAGALPLVAGVLSALLERERTGVARVVDSAITDGAASLLSMLLAMTDAGEWSPRRGSNLLDGGAPFYDVYRCSDGRHIAVGALEDRFYRAFVEGLGLDIDTLPDRRDRREWPGLRAAFAARIAERTRGEWTDTFDGRDACVTPVLTVQEAIAHPHHRARRSYRTVAGLVQPAPVPRFAGLPSDPGAPAPLPGEHTREILAGLGLDRTRVAGLLAAGVVRQAQ